MTDTDPLTAYKEVEDMLVTEHTDEARAIEQEAQALQATIAARSTEVKRASVLDRLFKRTV